MLVQLEKGVSKRGGLLKATVAVTEDYFSSAAASTLGLGGFPPINLYSLSTEWNTTPHALMCYHGKWNTTQCVPMCYHEKWNTSLVFLSVEAMTWYKTTTSIGLKFEMI